MISELDSGLSGPGSSPLENDYETGSLEIPDL